MKIRERFPTSVPMKMRELVQRYSQTHNTLTVEVVSRVVKLIHGDEGSNIAAPPSPEPAQRGLTGQDSWPFFLVIYCLILPALYAEKKREKNVSTSLF